MDAQGLDYAKLLKGPEETVIELKGKRKTPFDSLLKFSDLHK